MKRIPLSIPNFEGNERAYVDDAIDQGWISTGGAYITQLEGQLADFLGVEQVAACQSGTSAIHLSLIDAGVQPGDTVLVTPLTFIAAVNPVKYQFANPVFIDCDDSLCMDPLMVRKFCEEECVFKKGALWHNDSAVKALIVVHVFGNMADMEAIMEIAAEYNIKVIEDATEALGTKYTSGKYAGKYAGTIGDYGAYSFNGNKIITTGGGGAVTAKKAETVEHLRYLSTQAKDDPHFYIHNEVGYNYRMTNLQAALGVAQMEELPEFIERKNKNYDLYAKLFADYNLVKLMKFRSNTASNKWFYSLILNRDIVTKSLHEIVETLSQKYGIESRPIWGLINEQKPYATATAYNIEKAKYYSERVLNIPSTTQITEDEIHYVVNSIKELLRS